MPTQAVVHMVENGGRHTPAELCSQWEYLCRKGKLELKRSKRYGEAVVPHDQLPDWARNWLEQTGRYYRGQQDEDSEQQLTTHLVVPFPRPATGLPGEDYNRYYASYVAAAEHIAREWASEMFDSRNHGGRWDYVTAFHTDRPHPHLHVVVNRESFPNLQDPERTTLLSISPDNELINCNRMRDVLVQVTDRLNEEWRLRRDARANLIQLEASSRAERGIPGRSLTTGQFRQQMRVGAAMRNFADDAQNAEFDFTAPAPNAGPSAQGPRAGQQPGATQQGGGQGALDQEARPVAPVPRRQIEGDPQIATRIEEWRQGVATALSSDDGQGRPPTERPPADEQSQIDDRLRREAVQFHRNRADEERTRRETEDGGRDFDRRRTPARQSENDQSRIDEELRGEAARYRQDQIEEQRLRRDEQQDDRDMNRRRTPERSSNDQELIDTQLRAAAERNNRSTPERLPLVNDDAQFFGGDESGVNNSDIGDHLANEEDRSDVEIQDNVDGEAVGGQANRRRGNRGAQVRSRVETRGQQLRRLLQEREERRRRRRGDHIDWTIETRGQERARLAAEAEARRQHRRGDDLERVVETRAQQRARLRTEADNRRRDVPANQPAPPQSAPVRQTPPAGQQGSGGSGGIDGGRSDARRARGDRTRERNARSRQD